MLKIISLSSPYLLSIRGISFDINKSNIITIALYSDLLKCDLCSYLQENTGKNVNKIDILK